MTTLSAVAVLGLSSHGLGPLSADDLVALAISPFLVVGVAIFVVEDLLNAEDHVAAGVGGGLLAVMAVVVPADLNVAAAVALYRELGWRIGFQLERPIAVYWGLWAAIFLLGAWEERTEHRETEGDSPRT